MGDTEHPQEEVQKMDHLMMRTLDNFNSDSEPYCFQNTTLSVSA